MADNAEKKRVAFVKSIPTKNGPMEKVSIELNQVGTVFEKDGRTFLEIPKDCKFFNKYEKDGQNPRYFLNFILNTYKSMAPDEYEPDANNNSGGGTGDNDDLPF